MIQLTHITKEYRFGEKSQTVLNDISITISEGECVGCFGASGSGKSTLLNIIGLLDSPSGGVVSIAGRDCCRLTDRERAEIRGERIGFVFQSFHLEPRYTVWQNVEVPLLLTNLKSTERAERISQVLAKVGLEAMAKKKASLLSGGEQQRVAIARAIVRNPDIILADEPCGNLDAENKETVMRILKSLSNEGKTVLIVTHDREAVKFCTRILLLKNGKIIDEK